MGQIWGNADTRNKIKYKPSERLSPKGHVLPHPLPPYILFLLDSSIPFIYPIPFLVSLSFPPVGMHDHHGFHFNRKRKADSEDVQDSATDIVVDALLVDQPPSPSPTCASAPRQPCLAPGGVIWDSSSTVPPHDLLQSPAKRPRRDKHVDAGPTGAPARRSVRRFPTRVAPARPPPTERYGSDVEDIGIVCESDPGPSTGSLLRLREPPKSAAPLPVISSFSLESSQQHIPPIQPLVSRHSLKELDLDTILRNPQLRHDLLFDSGIQFRPTGSRRKRQLADKYWKAVITELETGCTCLSFDSQNRPYFPVVCACNYTPVPTDTPVSAVSLGITTLRTPSRIRPLLAEFLEVLMAVLQPLSSISGMYVNPGSFKSQIQEHRDQASHIRSIFDPALIEQELKHRVFDPSGLFRAIGAILKAHCAPIRDQAVESMMQTAAACTAGPQTSRSATIRVLRQTLDILELMKLDIANHQIQTLQPYLKRSAAHWELNTFKVLQNNSSLTLTREWVWRAHSSMLSRSKVLLHPSYPEGINHRKLNRNQQLYIATLKGLVDLVFTPPIHVSPSSLSSPSETPPAHTATSLPGYPETFYLDSNRLVLLSADVADLTALFMFLLLYRQLLCSVNINSGLGVAPTRVETSELTKLKNEIRDIGSSRLGHCFYTSSLLDKGHNEEKWQRTKQDIVLQIALRAKQSQSKTSAALHPLSYPLSLASSPAASPPASASPSPSSSRCSSPLSPSPLPSCISSLGHVPDERTLTVAQRWADLNIQPTSPLATMLRNRLRDVVFGAVVAMAYPGRDSAVRKLGMPDFLEIIGCGPGVDVTSATGMEPFADEIRAVSEKITRLALVHLNAFLPLYEHPSFMEILA